MTKPFDHNDHEAIRAALDDPSEDNEIAQAIAVRLEALTDILKQTVAERGEMPKEVEFTKPKTALDRIVIEMFEDVLKTESAALAESLGVDPSSLPVVRILDHGQQ